MVPLENINIQNIFYIAKKHKNSFTDVLFAWPSIHFPLRFFQPVFCEKNNAKWAQRFR